MGNGSERKRRRRVMVGRQAPNSVMGVDAGQRRTRYRNGYSRCRRLMESTAPHQPAPGVPLSPPPPSCLPMKPSPDHVIDIFDDSAAVANCCHWVDEQSPAAFGAPPQRSIRRRLRQPKLATSKLNPPSNDHDHDHDYDRDPDLNTLSTDQLIP